MKTNYLLFILLLGIFCLFSSCSKSGDSITPLSIGTNPDEVFLAQNSQVEIFIFNNDDNIPQSGTLSISEPSLGSAVINNNNTPENVNDDYLVYTAYANTIGSDSFQYTICDISENCEVETVSITINSSTIVNVFEGNEPFETLSEYNFFQGDLKDLNPTFGVLPYNLISTLFTDYAKKKRFVWIPNGVKANYVDDYSPLDFPTGTIIIKNFFYDNVLPDNSTKIIETRMMYKKPDGWDFANYHWNDEQTEAFLDNSASTVNLSWIDNEAVKTVNYQVPSRSQCFTCHNQNSEPIPIGPKPQNLNRTNNYDGGEMNQLTKLISFGYLENSLPNTIDTVVGYNDESQNLEDRVRSYLDINCAHCHSEESYCNYRPMRFAYNDSHIAENLGVCVEPETQFIPNSDIVKPNNLDESILYYRINTTEESFRMPLFGRTLIHDEGVRLVEEWILSLDECN